MSYQAMNQQNQDHHEGAHSSITTDSSNLIDSGETGAGGYDCEPARAVPWMAIAAVGHALLLFVAALIVFQVAVYAEVPPLEAELINQEFAPLPEEPEPEKVEIPEEEPIVEDPTDVPEVEEEVAEVVDVPTVNPLDSPEDLSLSESAKPIDAHNSAVGFGSSGGGPGGGNRGGPRGYGGGPSGIDFRVYEKRVRAALLWLADHQARDGSWRPHAFLDDSKRLERGATITRNIDFNTHVPREADTGWESAQVGLTALAMLAFVTNGQSTQLGEFRHEVKVAARWLLSQQRADGQFGPGGLDESAYNHAIATMALIELYGIDERPQLKAPTRDAIRYMLKARNEGAAWRYEPQSKDNDSSVTAWNILALNSAVLKGLISPGESDIELVYHDANAWFDNMWGENDQGYKETGYRIRGLGCARLEGAQKWTRTASMDACNLMVRYFSADALRTLPKDQMRGAKSNILKNLPGWHQGEEAAGPYAIDMYYWYYGTLALFQAGGGAWGQWEQALFKTALFPAQRGYHKKDVAEYGVVMADEKEARWILDEHGSWDPVGAWGSAGGRVYSTAINALTMQVYYRYKRLHESK